jgi:hypothetical protein
MCVCVKFVCVSCDGFLFSCGPLDARAHTHTHEFAKSCIAGSYVLIAYLAISRREEGAEEDGEMGQLGRCARV